MTDRQEFTKHLRALADLLDANRKADRVRAMRTRITELERELGLSNDHA